MTLTVSPDGDTLLIVKQLASSSTAPSEILAMPAGGGDAEVLVEDGGGRNIGVHYIGGGRQIIWTRTMYESDSGYDRPDSTQIWRASADGTGATMVYEEFSTIPEAVLLTTGQPTGCSISFSRSSGAGGFLAAAAGLVALLLGRRRRQLRPRS